MKFLRIHKKAFSGPYLFGLFVMALSFSLYGLFLVGFENLEMAVQSWQRGIKLVCYLDPKLPEPHRQMVIDQLSLKLGAKEVKYLSPKEVKEDLMNQLGSFAEGLEVVEEGFFPPSVEIAFGSPKSVQELESLAILASQVNGVQEVLYGGPWLKKAFEVLEFLKRSLWAMGIFLVGISFFISASTLRLVFYQRKEEIEILRLVGATESFVKIPFVLEGIFQGLIGAALAVLIANASALYLHENLPSWLSLYLPQAKVLSLKSTAILLALGMASGLLGGALACPGSDSL